MKKIIQTAILVFGSIVFVNAQTIIPKVGVTFTSNNFDYGDEDVDFDASGKTGISFGVGYAIPVGSIGKGIFSVQPELSFTQKGFKTEYSSTFQEGDFISTSGIREKYTINYLELPVLAKIEFGNTNFKWHVNVGPSVALGLGGKYKSTYFVEEPGYSYSEDSNGKIKFGEATPDEGSDDAYINNRLDIGVQVGGGVTLFEYIYVDVRYGMGLTDLMDDFTSKNRVLNFTVGVPLKF